MSRRPQIPAEVSRAVLVEAGHRCAVCGTSCPLERAHIIPWRRSKQHQKEDLICLCANCHARADKEKWGERTLREYKKQPWIVRQGAAPSSKKQERKQLGLRLGLLVLPVFAASSLILVWLLASSYREATALRELGDLGATIALGEDKGLRVTFAKPLGNPGLERRVDAIRKLAHVHELELRRILDLSDLSPLRDLPPIERLTLTSLGQVTDLAPLKDIPHLKQLELWDLEQLHDLSPLAEISSLEDLGLGALTRVEDLSFLERASGLRRLRMSSLRSLDNIAPLSSITDLEYLELRFLPQINDLSPLRNLTHLRYLKLESLPHLTDLSPLRDLTQLEELEIISLPGVSNLSPISSLRSLRRIHLSLLSEVRDLSALEELNAVEHLVLWDLNHVDDLGCLRRLGNMRYLKVGQLPASLDQSLLQALYSLETLEIGDPVRILAPQALQRLPHFRTLAFGAGYQLSVEEVTTFMGSELDEPRADELFFRPPQVATPAEARGCCAIRPRVDSSSGVRQKLDGDPTTQAIAGALRPTIKRLRRPFLRTRCGPLSRLNNGEAGFSLSCEVVQ